MASSPHADLTLIGGPTVLIELDGARLLTDPTFDDPGSFALGAVQLHKTERAAIEPTALGRVDAVLLSHDQHADNFDEAGRRFAAGVPTIFTTCEANARLGANTVGLADWDAAALETPGDGRFVVTAVPARHGPPGIERRVGTVAGFVVQDASGVDRVYVTGDTVFYDGIQDVARRFDPAVVIAFAGAARTRGPFNLTMGNNDVLELARTFPRATIAVVHNSGWAHFTEGPDSLAAVVDTFGLKERVFSLEPGRRTRIG